VCDWSAGSPYPISRLRRAASYHEAPKGVGDLIKQNVYACVRALPILELGLTPRATLSLFVGKPACGKKAMRDYSMWPMKPLSVANLKLDPQNPRIPPAERPFSQRELIRELVEHDNVYGLAQSIVNHGFFPTEPLVAVDEDGDKVVIEGNRRLAALKILLSPRTAPDNHVQKFSRLADRVSPPIISKVHTVVAPSREAAVPMIVERHTRQQIQNWVPAMQARFYRSLLERGLTAEQLKENYGITPGQLSDFLRLDTMYKIACSLDLADAIKDKVHNPHKFPLTNLERALESTLVRDFLRIETHPEDIFSGKGDPEQFKSALGKIVADVAEGDVDSRKLRDKKAIQKYLQRISKFKPDPKKRGKFSALDLIKEPTPKPPKTPPKPTKRRRRSRGVLPTSLKCQVGSQRINDVFSELRRIHPDKTPNAAAMMLRVLLDLCVSNYLDNCEAGRKEIKRWRKKTKASPDVDPPLKYKLGVLLEKLDLPIDASHLRALKRFKNQKNAPLALDDLHAFAHNRYVSPTEKDIRGIVEVLDPLLHIILAEPGPEQSK